MTAPELPLDAYVRVSRVGGRSGEAFISPEVQRDNIARWAQLRGVTIGETFTDLDESGAKTDRPALGEALERVEAGVSGGVVVAKLDRFARSLPGAMELVKRLDDAGGVLASVAEGIDPTTPAGKLQRNLFLMLAEFHLDTIREGWRVAQERAVERGVYIASKAPTGYRHDESGRLVPNGHADAIRELFELRAGGASWRQCCNLLNERRVVGPWGPSEWQADAVTGIVRSRAYLGESRFGHLVNTSAHEPLTDPATWKTAQRAPLASTPRNGEGALLAGFIRCAGCRYLMKPSKRTHRGEKVRIYECGKTYAAGRCPAPATVLGRVIEPHVLEHFRRLVGSPEFASEEPTEDLDGARRELGEAEDALSTFRDDERVIAALGADRFAEGLQARVARVDGLEARVAALGQRAHVTSRLDLAELLERGSVSERRELLRGAIGAVFVRNLGRRAPVTERVTVLDLEELPADLPRRGRRAAIGSFRWPDDAPAGAGVAAG